MTHDDVNGPGPQMWLPQEPIPPLEPAEPAGYGQPAHAQPTFVPPRYAQPTYAQPTYAQPTYAQPTYAQPTYGQPVADPYSTQDPFGGPGPYGAPGPYGGAPVPYPAPTPYPTYYGPTSYGTPPSQTPVLAIVGLVLAVILAPVGIIVSIVALVKVRTTGVGRGLASAGLVVGCFWILAAMAIPVYLNQRLGGAEGAGAREAFHAMEQSLIDADCAAFVAITTEGLRSDIGIFSCDEFQMMVDAANAGPVPFGHVPVTSVEVDGDVATIWTVERAVDASGEGTTLDRVEYRAVRTDGVWRIDWVDLG